MLFATTLLASSVHAQSMEPGPVLGHAPTEITMAVEIDAPISEVWETFSQIGNIYLNSPTVSVSHLSSEVGEGIGATRHMEMSLKKGATLDERVIAWQDGTYMALEVYQINNVTGIQTMGGDFRLEESGGKTILTSTLNYSMTNAFFGAMNRMMMKNQFVDLWASVLAGYKEHIETGAEVTAETRLNLDPVALIRIDVG